MPLKLSWLPLPHRRSKASAGCETTFRDQAAKPAFSFPVNFSHSCQSAERERQQRSQP
jgi:hypothetical protein